jgi:hypothetical protein
MLKLTSFLFRMSTLRNASIILAISLSFVAMFPAYAQEAPPTDNSALILHEFNQQNRSDIRAKAIPLKEKQQIMFLLGLGVILLVIVTGGLGLAMGVFGKPLFVAHMLFAALSITLAIAHAIVGLVWFYPF